MRARVVAYQPALLDGSGNVMGYGRSRGLHLGDVIAHMKTVHGGAVPEWDNDNFVKAGFMLEMWIAQALSKYVGYDMAGRLVEPGECEVDRIFLNPDRVEPEAETLWEFKATWLSMKKLFDLDPRCSGNPCECPVSLKGLMEHRWAWLVQVLSYSRAMGVVRIRLAIMFMNGDYSFKAPHGGPQIRVVEIVVTEVEQEKNWAMVIANAADLRRVNGEA